MMNKEIEFVLPLGFEDEDGNLHREGKMRVATALDEIEINNHEKASGVSRYRDCLLLSRVITRLGTYTKIEPEMIEELYEVDFIYLQSVYNNLFSDYSDVIVSVCPHCDNQNNIMLSNLYKDMQFLPK